MEVELLAAKVLSTWCKQLKRCVRTMIAIVCAQVSTLEEPINFRCTKCLISYITYFRVQLPLS